MTPTTSMTMQTLGKIASWETTELDGRLLAAAAFEDWGAFIRTQMTGAEPTDMAVEFAVNAAKEIAEDLKSGRERSRAPLSLEEVPPIIALVNATGPMTESILEGPRPGSLSAFLAICEIATVWGQAATETRAASGWTEDQACQEPCCQGNLVAAVWRTELQQRALRADIDAQDGPLGVN